MDIILQHRITGLYFAQDKDWVSANQQAHAFPTAREAVRFANAQRFAPQVRLVARMEQNRYRILMPLIGSLPSHQPRS
jgi:hypothetical protein